jgi:hypothetical protein
MVIDHREMPTLGFDVTLITLAVFPALQSPLLRHLREIKFFKQVINAILAGRRTQG